MKEISYNPVIELPLADFLEGLKIKDQNRDAMTKYRDWVDYYDHHVDRLRSQPVQPEDLQDTARALVFGNMPIIDELMSEAQASRTDPDAALDRLNTAAEMISDRYGRFAMTDMDAASREHGMVDAYLRMGDVAKTSYLLGTDRAQRASLDASEWQMSQLPRHSDIQMELFTMGKQVYKDSNPRAANLGYDSSSAVRQYRHPAHVFDRMKQLLQNGDLVAAPGSNELTPRAVVLKI